MTIGERIKILREKLNITQEEFSQRLGTTRNTVTNYEANRRIPMDATIKSICREFNVSETWLRTGEGEMFRELSRDEELAKFFGEVSFGESDFKRRFLMVLSQLDESGWQLLEDMALKLAEEAKKDKEKAGP